MHPHSSSSPCLMILSCACCISNPILARYKAKGFTVVGFPCNQFGAQEPGDNSTIKRFAQSNYGATVSGMRWGG